MLNITTVFDHLASAVRLASITARRLQGKVLNDGKPGRVFDDDSEALIAKRSAKTIVDEIVQEQILLAASEVLDPALLTVDAEESTPSLSLFTGAQGSPTLIIDPVDGTAEYIAGLTNYSICVALADSGIVRIAIVYFPARDVFYCLSPDGSRFTHEFLERGISKLEDLKVAPNSRSRVVFHNSRVPGGVLDRLKESGLTPIDDTHQNLGCPDAILRVAKGEALAYVAHTRQMRDMLLGAILQGADGLCALDWSGAALRWPNGGRVPRAVFAPRLLPKSFLGCLNVA